MVNRVRGEGSEDFTYYRPENSARPCGHGQLGLEVSAMTRIPLRWSVDTVERVDVGVIARKAELAFTATSLLF